MHTLCSLHRLCATQSRSIAPLCSLRLPNQDCGNFQRRNFYAGSPLRFKKQVFKLADIGEGIAEVTIQKWFKTAGESVEEMEVVCTAESDKATVEISSPYTGKVSKVHHKEGDVVPIGEPLLDVETDSTEDDVEDDAKEDAHHASNGSPSSPSDIEHVEEAPHPPSEGSIDLEADATHGSSSSKNTSGAQGKAVLASPACRAFARQHNVDLGQVTGTGKAGIITKEDVQAYLDHKGKDGESSDPQKHDGRGNSTTHGRKALSTAAKAMVKEMERSLSMPRMTLVEEVDVTELLRMKKRLATAAKVTEANVLGRISITSLIVKATSMSLSKHPIINSRLATSKTEVEVYSDHNISIAVDTPNGLIVPTMYNVQNRNLSQIQSEMSRIHRAALEMKLKPSEIKNGTICITNFGVVGGITAQPINYDAQAAIIGIGRLQVVPRYPNATAELLTDDGDALPEPRAILNISLTADHRHLDGATVARYLAEMKSLLENPEILLM